MVRSSSLNCWKDLNTCKINAMRIMNHRPRVNFFIFLFIVHKFTMFQHSLINSFKLQTIFTIVDVDVSLHEFSFGGVWWHAANRKHREYTSIWHRVCREAEQCVPARCCAPASYVQCRAHTLSSLCRWIDAAAHIYDWPNLAYEVSWWVFEWQRLWQMACHPKYASLVDACNAVPSYACDSRRSCRGWFVGRHWLLKMKMKTLN